MCRGNAGEARDTSSLTRRKNTLFGTYDAQPEAALTMLRSLRSDYTPQYESTLSEFVEPRNAAEPSATLWETGSDC